MTLELTMSGRRVELERPIDISIPLRFNGPQPNAFGVEPATAEPCSAGRLVGDTRRGGSCNFEQYTLIPHCNGTHTECVGHITHERILIRDCLQDVLAQALVVSVNVVDTDQTDETYAVPFEKDDRLITRASLSKLMLRDMAPPNSPEGTVSALIVRTMPNHDSKLTRGYGEAELPPYFTTEAMEFIVECGFNHLLVDLPSIDRMNDDGKLSNHRIFWNVDQGSFETKQGTRIGSTITEFIFVPTSVIDGGYALNLQIAPFAADASPSRPLLFQYVEQ